MATGERACSVGTLSSPVSTLHFVADQNLSNEGGEGGTSPTNHWSLFLELNNRTSVRVEVVPDDPGRPGMVLLENKGYSVTTNLARKVSAAAPNSGTTVATVLNIIIAKGRDRYILQPVGEGCRFWLFTLASDFVTERILPVDSMKEVQSALPFYWPYPYGTPPVERPMSEGTFF